MMIHTSVALKTVRVDGITVNVNTTQAKEIKRKYPKAEVTRMYPKKRKKVGHGKCVCIPVENYLQSCQSVQ